MRLLLLLLLLLIYPVGGAIIHGTVYAWDTLKPLPKAIVTINTTPEQRIVTENGNYSFVVPPGTYVIKAYYYNHGELELYDEENITVKGNGSYVLDLILFPNLNYNESMPNIQLNLGSEGSTLPISLLVFLPAIFLVLLFIFTRRRSEREISREVREAERIEEQVKRDELPEDLKEIVEIIRKEGGRITQKDLRKKLGYSEAKVSLMIADLERRGVVEKVRRGRGNIIFLKE